MITIRRGTLSASWRLEQAHRAYRSRVRLAIFYWAFAVVYGSWLPWPGVGGGSWGLDGSRCSAWSCSCSVDAHSRKRIGISENPSRTRKEKAMGDIGEPLKHIELEPVEAPVQVPVPEEVPA